MSKQKLLLIHFLFSCNFHKDSFWFLMLHRVSFSGPKWYSTLSTVSIYIYLPVVQIWSRYDKFQVGNWTQWYFVTKFHRSGRYHFLAASFWLITWLKMLHLIPFQVHDIALSFRILLETNPNASLQRIFINGT